jgi:hypothetical protein
MELLELVNVVVSLDDDHDSSCPWHEKDKPPGGKLEPAHTEDDVDEMQDNEAGKLASSLKGKGAPRPAKLPVQVAYKKDRTEIVDPGTDDAKAVAVYKPAPAEEYFASYAAHHIIPGNETLKGHPIVAWMGGSAEIDGGKDEGKPTSVINDGEYIGYDINDSENGIWLPGPYPLSTKKSWPAKTAMSDAVKANLITDNDVKAASSFKEAYAFAVIKEARKPYDATANDKKHYIGCQLHFRHDEYSRGMKLMLTKIRLKLVHFSKECPIPKDQKKKGDKFPAPLGLKGRMEGVSFRMRQHLVGPQWNKFVYTDDLSKRYIDKIAQG